MKSIRNLFIVFCTLILLLSMNVSESRADWCRITCEDIPYGPVMTHPFEFGGCLFEVDFAYRNANCGDQGIITCDFYIVAIRPIVPCDNPLVTPFGLMDKAQREILENPALNPCLPPSGCNFVTSISYASCWYWEGDGGTAGPGSAVLTPCDETQCCRNIYKVCNDPPGPNATLLSTNGINPVCPSWECFSICEEYTQPPSFPSGIEKDYDSGHNFNTTVFPNPSADLINLKIESDTEGELTVEINDVLGNIIVTKNIMKKQGEIQLQFKMSSYSNGNYYFVVKQNGKQVSNGSFNIIK